MGVKVKERPKGSGVWWLFINHKGQRRSKKIGDKRKAQDMAKQIQAHLTLGDDTSLKKKKTFGEYADDYINITIPQYSKPKTVAAYKVCLNAHILPLFKNRPVDSITKYEVRKFLLSKLKNNANADNSVRVMKSVLAGVFTLAIQDEAIMNNPALQIGKLYGDKKTVALPNPLSGQELNRLLDAFQKHHPQDYPAMFLLARTGLRIGELFALKWEDIDFVSREIHIERTRDDHNRITKPKRNKTRVVDMSRDLCEVLKQYKHNLKEKTLRNGWSEFPEWFYTNDNGQMTSIMWWRNKRFAPMLEKAEVKKVRPHDIRHTYASLLLMAGQNVLYVQKQLGHSDPRMTLEVYSHWLPEEKNDVKGVDVLDATRRNLSATNHLRRG
jgi:integrase